MTLTKNFDLAKVKIDLHTKYQGHGSTSSSRKAQRNKPTDSWTDRLYQVHYLPALHSIINTKTSQLIYVPKENDVDTYSILYYNEHVYFLQFLPFTSINYGIFLQKYHSKGLQVTRLLFSQNWWMTAILDNVCQNCAHQLECLETKHHNAPK